MKNKSIQILETIVLRSPIFPLNHYNRIPENNKDLNDFVKNLYENKTFKEGIFIASPDLFEIWEESIISKKKSIESHTQINKSILKYYIRSITNCVPFGLFASYSILKKDRIQEDSQCNKYKKYIDIKLSIISDIIDLLHSSNIIQNKITYRVNETISVAGNKCNYIEFDKNREGERTFIISDIEFDSVLKLILSSCNEVSRTKKELINLILNNVTPVTYKEAELYVNELISSKILLSNWDLCINDIRPLQQVISFIEQNYDDNWLQDRFLTKTIKTIYALDKAINEFNEFDDYIDFYKKISQIIQPLISQSQKQLIDVDLKRLKAPIALTKNISEDMGYIQKAITIMASLSTQKPTITYTSLKNLSNFKEAFISRYGDSEVPLLEALNRELGIGYIQHSDEPNISDFIKDLNFPIINSIYGMLHTDSIADKFWVSTIMQAIRDGKTSINLEDKDLNVFETKNIDLIGTFPITYTHHNDKIYITAAGGTSSLLYLGRFMCNDNELKEFGDEIIQIEKNSFPNQILAEIIHIPTYANGKIAMRNTKRDYEISILNKSSNSIEKIKLEDLIIFIRQDTIILKSKRLNKEVIPCLSCAQNFHSDTIPIYHFLCDLQMQYRSNILSLDISPFIYKYFKFIPRIQYNDKIVLSLARWQFDIIECDLFLDESKNIIFETFQEFRKKHKIPKYVFLVKKNSEPLTINTENEILVNFIGDELKKSSLISLIECIYDFDNIKEDSGIANQVILTCKGNPYLNNNSFLRVKKNKKSVPRSFIPGEEWLYYKIYTGTNIADIILRKFIKNVVEILETKGIIDKWFFIRYNDPQFHIRLRFHFTNKKNKNLIMDIFNNNIRQYIENKMISKVELSTYERELERYFHSNIEDSENIFYHDSNLVINLLEDLKVSDEYELIWIYALKNIHEILNVFSFSISQREVFLKHLYGMFSIEFNADKKVRKQVDCKFRDFYNTIEDVFSEESYRSNLFRKRNLLIENSVERIKKDLSLEEQSDLLGSHIHMSINRIIKHAPRIHEFVLYGILEKYYRKYSGQIKYRTLN